MCWVTLLVRTEQVSVALRCRVCRLLTEKRRRDLLLRLAKLRRGVMALWNRPPWPLTPSSSSSSLSSSSSSFFSLEVPHIRSRAPCKEWRMLPTQLVTWSWAADSFPPKYCMVGKKKAQTTGCPGTEVTMETVSPQKLSRWRWWDCFQKAGTKILISVIIFSKLRKHVGQMFLTLSEEWSKKSICYQSGISSLSPYFLRSHKLPGKVSCLLWVKK